MTQTRMGVVYIFSYVHPVENTCVYVLLTLKKKVTFLKVAFYDILKLTNNQIDPRTNTCLQIL